MRESYEFHGRCKRPARSDTKHAHADTVRAVMEYVSTRFRQRLKLDDIAAVVHCAPNHLCWLFKRETGLPIHRYVIRLRLAAALERLADVESLALLAMDLGFSHHSHFTAAFRREFGVQPARLRETLNVAGIRQMRKNLIA